VVWASCGPLQFTHLSTVWLQGRPRIRQVAVGQVWPPVGCGEAHHRHEAGLVHLLLSVFPTGQADGRPAYRP